MNQCKKEQATTSPEKRNYNQHDHEVMDKHGKKYKFYNIAQFAFDHQMSTPMLSKLVNGHVKQTSGWTLISKPTAYKKHERAFVSPTGVVTIITNIRKMSQDTGIPQHWIRQLVDGKRTEADGWRMHDGGIENAVRQVPVKVVKDEDFNSAFDDCFQIFMKA